MHMWQHIPLGDHDQLWIVLDLPPAMACTAIEGRQQTKAGADKILGWSFIGEA
ncbi:hypothetical protein [Mesorhizobium sp.]|uniref:hypothetical protein n=1 Tax=Mesorhizobium sp. TaxID=1871066 RepID=UPI0025CEF038|nr:hypothetical protein [Mesorhizobium sp.]